MMTSPAALFFLYPQSECWLLKSPVITVGCVSVGNGGCGQFSSGGTFMRVISSSFNVVR